MSRPLLILFTFVFLVSCKREGVQDSKYKRIERETFAVELPDWKVEVDEGSVGLGKYKVSRKKAFSAEVAWQGGQALSIKDMEDLITVLAKGFDLTRAERSTEVLPDQLRAHMVASIDGKVWMVMTLITCKKTGVMITLGFVSRKKGDSKYMQERALKSFECRGDAPVAGMAFPAVELDTTFGQYIESDMLVLANQDGETLIVIGGSADTVEGARKYPDKIMRVFSEILGLSLEGGGKILSQKGLGGVEQWIGPGKDTDGSTVAIGGFACPDIGQGFFLMVFGGSEARVTTLSALASQVGCPNENTTPVQSRKTACEVGVAEYCEPEHR